LEDHVGLIPQFLIVFFVFPGRSCKIKTLIMERTVYFFLAQQGSELPEDADCVTCTDDKNITQLKKLAHEANKNMLSGAGVDSSKLEVFEYGENGAKCPWNAKLSLCNSGIEDKPFRIFYEGIPVDSRFF
jgi:hypothetical protein